MTNYTQNEAIENYSQIDPENRNTTAMMSILSKSVYGEYNKKISDKQTNRNKITPEELKKIYESWEAEADSKDTLFANSDKKKPHYGFSEWTPMTNLSLSNKFKTGTDNVIIRGEGGFAATALLKSASREIILVFRGTDDIKDISLSDVQILIKKEPQQVKQAELLFDKLSRNFADYAIILTGQSLGGTIAQYLGAKYGLLTFTFEAPAANLQSNENTSNIHNYIGLDDVIGNYNSENSLGNTRYKLNDDNYLGEIYSPHSNYIRNDFSEYKPLAEGAKWDMKDALFLNTNDKRNKPSLPLKFGRFLNSLFPASSTEENLAKILKDYNDKPAILYHNQNLNNIINGINNNSTENNTKNLKQDNFIANTSDFMSGEIEKTDEISFNSDEVKFDEIENSESNSGIFDFNELNEFTNPDTSQEILTENIEVNENEIFSEEILPLSGNFEFNDTLNFTLAEYLQDVCLVKGYEKFDSEGCRSGFVSEFINILENCKNEIFVEKPAVITKVHTPYLVDIKYFDKNGADYLYKVPVKNLQTSSAFVYLALKEGDSGTVRFLDNEATAFLKSFEKLPYPSQNTHSINYNLFSAGFFPDAKQYELPQGDVVIGTNTGALISINGNNITISGGNININSDNVNICGKNFLQHTHSNGNDGSPTGAVI